MKVLRSIVVENFQDEDEVPFWCAAVKGMPELRQYAGDPMSALSGLLTQITREAEDIFWEQVNNK